jgi:predicted ATPase
MIQSVRFHNFKAIRDAEIALGGLTVLVGPNASGKTSVLQGLKYLCDLARLPARQVFEGRRSPKVLVTSDATGELSIGVEGQWGDTLSRVLLRVEAPVAWSFSLDGSWRGQSFHYTMPPGVATGSQTKNGNLLCVRRVLHSARTCPRPSFFAWTLRNWPSLRLLRVPELRYKKTGLDWLAWWRKWR